MSVCCNLAQEWKLKSTPECISSCFSTATLQNRSPSYTATALVIDYNGTRSVKASDGLGFWGLR
eukprot:6220933-Amphidinium_carterae.1